VQVTAYGRQTVPDWGVVRSCDPFKFWGSNHITGTAEPKVVKFDTHIRYINSTNIITYHQQKRCVCGHGTVLRFCCLLWCSASRGFVSDSWATCGRPYNTGVWQTDRQTDRRSNRRIHDDSMYGANIASRGKNVFDRGSRSHIPRCCVTTSIRAGRWALTLTYDLDLWPWLSVTSRRAVIMIHTKKSSSVETNGRKLRFADCFDFPANAVGSNAVESFRIALRRRVKVAQHYTYRTHDDKCFYLRQSIVWSIVVK